MCFFSWHIVMNFRGEGRLKLVGNWGVQWKSNDWMRGGDCAGESIEVESLGLCWFGLWWWWCWWNCERLQ